MPIKPSNLKALVLALAVTGKFLILMVMNTLTGVFAYNLFTERLGIAVITTLVVSMFFSTYLMFRKEGEKAALAEKKIEQIETKAEKEPEKTKFSGTWHE